MRLMAVDDTAITFPDLPFKNTTGERGVVSSRMESSRCCTCFAWGTAFFGMGRIHEILTVCCIECFRINFTYFRVAVLARMPCLSVFDWNVDSILRYYYTIFDGIAFDNVISLEVCCLCLSHTASIRPDLPAHTVPTLRDFTAI